MILFLFVIFWLLFFCFEVVQAGLCLILGAALNINKQHHWLNAQRANDIVLVLNIVIVAVNIVINAFDTRETT